MRGRGDGLQQACLPSVLPEEVPLASEVVLDGEPLDRRRREALGALRALLVDRPAEFSPEEWRVAVAHLASPVAHLRRTPGSHLARLGVLRVARECFPADAPTTALRRYREALALPHVATFVADLRALELADVVEQRSLVRERLWHLADMGLQVTAAEAKDPEGGANACRVAATSAVALKILVDMDALALRPEDVAPPADPGADGDDPAEVAAELQRRIGRVAADLRERRREPAGAA